jgi:translation initiation factor IF-2
LWVFLPLFCGRSHHVSPFVFFVFCSSNNKPHPLVASRGSAPNWGTGSRSWPWGAPRGGPRGRPVIGPRFLIQKAINRPWGGPGGAPGGPRGGRGVAQGGLGRGPGDPPRRVPPGGPRGARPPYGEDSPTGAAPTAGPSCVDALLEKGGGGGVGGPRGGRGGAPGAAGGVGGPRPGGSPRGGPLVAALSSDLTALLEPPPWGAPRGGPPGGHFWGVRTRWGQNQAKSSLTVVYRGGRGAPPKAHCVRSLQGGPKSAQV